jgi:hypothetical protein
MPVLKLFEKGQSRQTNLQPRSQAKDVLSKILQKRIADGLIKPQATEQIVLNSGGVLRELIRIANECCRIALRLIRRKPGQLVIIDEQILDEAVNNIRNDFAVPLGKVDYAILQTTYQNFMPDDPKELDFLDLLHGLYVLEYRNRKNWYDVHPIVVELLRDQGLINGSQPII